jgi:hypothetical protein
MTGPEHYRRAEQLMESMTRMRAGEVIIRGDQLSLAAAQAHATLALAAATALGKSDFDFRAWVDAAGTKL